MPSTLSIRERRLLQSTAKKEKKLKANIFVDLYMPG